MNEWVDGWVDEWMNEYSSTILANVWHYDLTIKYDWLTES